MLLAILVSTTPLRPLAGSLRPLTGSRATPLVAMGYGDRGDASVVKPGDWTCGDCGANVFARKQACFRCGAPKGNSEAARMPASDEPYKRTSPNPNPDEPYMREPGDTDDEIEVALVEVMVAERAALRAAGDFGAADAVRGELAFMGVTVHELHGELLPRTQLNSRPLAAPQPHPHHHHHPRPPPPPPPPFPTSASPPASPSPSAPACPRPPASPSPSAHAGA